MSRYTDTQIMEIASHFRFEPVPVSCKELRSGNVNVTYRLDVDPADKSKSYILQRINTVAFKDPDSLMENIRLVTRYIKDAYIAKGQDPARRVLDFIDAAEGDTENGTLLYRDAEDSCWRAYRYVDDVTAYDRIESADLFREAGRGFGEFQTMLSAFPAEQLTETIVGFHNTPARYEVFLAKVAEDPAGRVASLSDEIAFFKSREGLMRGIVDRLADGTLPLRVTHNDTKLNNVLLDNATGKALCVIDLDTVRPGSSLYDYGDAVRYGACTAAEDEPDTSKIGFDMELFRAFTEGFVSTTAGSLTDTEIRLLPLGIAVITCELAMRFLTDYIDGDKYFKINCPDHNLVRARAQMKLLCEVEKAMPAMNAFVEGML